MQEIYSAILKNVSSLSDEDFYEAITNQCDAEEMYDLRYDEFNWIIYFTCVKSIQFKRLVCWFRYLHILSDTRKSSVLAGSKEFWSEKIQWKKQENLVGPYYALA